MRHYNSSPTHKYNGNKYGFIKARFQAERQFIQNYV